MPCINVPKLDKHGANAIDRRHTHAHTQRHTRRRRQSCLAAAEPNPMPRSPFQGVSWCACFILSLILLPSFRFGLFFSFLYVFILIPFLISAPPSGAHLNKCVRLPSLLPFFLYLSFSSLLPTLFRLASVPLLSARL